eukprot:Pgem_evm1s17609
MQEADFFPTDQTQESTSITTTNTAVITTKGHFEKEISKNTFRKNKNDEGIMSRSVIHKNPVLTNINPSSSVRKNVLYNKQNTKLVFPVKSNIDLEEVP